MALGTAGETCSLRAQVTLLPNNFHHVPSIFRTSTSGSTQTKLSLCSHAAISSKAEELVGEASRMFADRAAVVHHLLADYELDLCGRSRMLAAATQRQAADHHESA